MKRFIMSLVVLVLAGGGCIAVPAGREKMSVQKTVEQKTYSNSLGKYSFSHPNLFLQGAVATSTIVSVFNVPVGQVRPDNVFPAVEFKLIKGTSYPENTINQLKKEYFIQENYLKITTKQIKVGDVSGWEMSQTEQTDEFHPYSRLLYFPYGTYELLVFDYNDDEITEQIINSLTFVK